jgi:Uma2 family endonuclease
MVRAMHRAERPATYEDIVRLPENLVGELVAGELVVSPRPRVRHARAISGLASQLMPRVHGPARDGDGPGGWCLLLEAELHFGADVLVPDLTGWRWERFDVDGDVVGVTVVPDWVCEVISPSTARADRVLKMPVYARAGVKHLWIVDPALRTIEVYGLDGARWVVLGSHGGGDPVRMVPFDTVELAPASWWLD